MLKEIVGYGVVYLYEGLLEIEIKIVEQLFNLGVIQVNDIRFGVIFEFDLKLWYDEVFLIVWCYF